MKRRGLEKGPETGAPAEVVASESVEEGTGSVDKSVVEAADSAADQALETAIDREPTDFEGVVDVGPGAEQPVGVEPEPVSDAEVNAVEEAMAAGEDVNADTFAGELDTGFSAFGDHILAKLKLGKEAGAEFSELAKEFIGKLYGKFREVIEAMSVLYKKGEEAKAIKMGLDFVKQAKDEAHKHFADKADEWVEEHDGIVAEAEKQDDPKKKDRMLKLAMEAVDFIPFIGDLKMIAEGVAGKTAQGKKLSGFRRFAHTTEGAAFLAINIATVGGGTAAKGVKGGIKGGKLLTRSAAVFKKFGLSQKVYRPIFKAGKFVGKNPAVAKVVDKALTYAVYRRRVRKAGVAMKQGSITVDNIVEEQEAAKAAGSNQET